MHGHNNYSIVGILCPYVLKTLSRMPDLHNVSFISESVYPYTGVSKPSKNILHLQSYKDLICALINFLKVANWKRIGMITDDNAFYIQFVEAVHQKAKNVSDLWIQFSQISCFQYSVQGLQ